MGDGQLRTELEARIRSLKLEDFFILTGLLPPAEVPGLAGAMDVLAHPSHREGLARAIPQGQLAGCPVVAYDVGGNREGFVDGRSGMLVQFQDVETFARSTAALVASPSLRSTFGEAGKTFASKRFCARVMTARLHDIYMEAVGNR